MSPIPDINNGLDADMQDALLASQRSQTQPGDDALLACVAQRLSARIPGLAVTAAKPQVVTIDAHDGRWREFLPGVQRKTLLRQGDIVSVLLKLDLGAGLPPHHHHADEECVVLEGRLRLQDGTEIGPGGFHWVAEGTDHAELIALEPTTIFLRGALDANV
jgi:anti-sigma factor ChrR (cupin superfamily)